MVFFQHGQTPNGAVKCFCALSLSLAAVLTKWVSLSATNLSAVDEVYDFILAVDVCGLCDMKLKITLCLQR